MGGQQPVQSAHVYLFAASSAGYGTASQSLLTSGFDGTDSVGNYVLTNSTGNFTITGDYICTPGQQVYVYVLGGNPGAGANAVLGELAAVGSCPLAGNFLGTVPFIAVDEISTIAFAYGVSGYAVDPQHVASSGTPLATTGIANAFATASSLLSGATTAAGNGTIPVQELGTLGNILASCVNSTGAVTGPTNPTACYTLFNNATSRGTLPTDTAQAAINIAHNPAANVTTLFGLQDSNAPFGVQLSSAPNDFSIAISYTGGGLGTSLAETNQAGLLNNIATDAAGNVWRPNYGQNNITELSPLGAPLSGSAGYTGGGLNEPSNIAIDLNGNAWTANFGSNSVSEFSSSGTPNSGSPFTAGNVNAPLDLAIDGNGNVWILNAASLTELTSAGANASGSPFVNNNFSGAVGIAISSSEEVWVTNANANNVFVSTSSGAAASGSPFAGGGLNYPYGIAFDSSGAAWIADEQALTRLSSSGNPGSSPFPSPNNNEILTSLAVDGDGNIWVTDIGMNSIIEANNSGSYLSGAIGLQAGQTTVPEAITVDLSGNVWYSSFSDATVHELVGAAAPTVAPLSYAVAHSQLGVRP